MDLVGLMAGVCGFLGDVVRLCAEETEVASAPNKLGSPSRIRTYNLGLVRLRRTRSTGE